MAKDTSPNNGARKEIADLKAKIGELEEKNHELEETLDAIRSGEVDAIVISRGDVQQVYTLEGADQPYRILVENIQDGALTLSRTGIILYTNSRFAEMVKLPSEKVVSTSIIDYVCPEYKARLKDALQQIAEKACRTRIRIREGEDGSLPVILSMNPLTPEADTKISVVVTDRRKDEDRITFQARMLDAVGDAVIATDTDRKITYWNKAATTIYGWEPEEVMGHYLSKVKTRSVPKKELEKIAAELAAGRIRTGEYTGHHKNGHEFPVYVTEAPVFDDAGTFIGVIGASHDSTEEKRAKEQLASRNEELNALNEELSLREQDRVKSEANLKEALSEKEVLLSEIHHRVKNNLTAFISLLNLEGTYEDTEGGRVSA